MAKMEGDYNLKTSGERFQILCLLSMQKFTWYLPLDVPGAFCVWVKAFNLNFSEVLTKREENPRDTAPLIGAVCAQIEMNTVYRKLPLISPGFIQRF